MDKVITISREFGCGGREVGIKLAEMLGVPFYDKDIISKSASEEISQSERELLKQSYTPPFFENVIFSIDVFNQYQNPVDRMTFLKQAEVIRRLAADGVCVIVGRCAGSLLGNAAIKVFLYADVDFRLMRKQEQFPDVSERELKVRIQSIDHLRKSYYQQYTGSEWGARYDYDLCVNTARCGIDGTVETILTYLFPKGL